MVTNELVLMPDSLDLIKVNTGCEGDRVYRLNWKNSGTGAATSMFWLQAKNATKDEGANTPYHPPRTDPPPDPTPVIAPPPPQSLSRTLTTA